MTSTNPEWYRFRDAVETGDHTGANKLLEQTPSLIDRRNSIGETVLHFLAVENHQPGVDWLLREGADPNPINGAGTPLLFEVALLGYKDLFLFLVENGADPGVKHSEGQSIVEYLMEFEKADMIAFVKDLRGPAKNANAETLRPDQSGSNYVT